MQKQKFLYASSRNIYWGVTPAATSADKNYTLNVSYKDAAKTFTGGYPLYSGNKPVLTLKELDFRIRQLLIKTKDYISINIIKDRLKLQMAIINTSLI